MKDIVAIVLAGGVGKRWWPLTTYKPLFSFLGKSVLVSTLERLKISGINEAVVVTSPENYEKIRSVSVEGIKISTAIQKEANGMAAGVLAAKEFVKDKPCLIVNVGDLLSEQYYRDLKIALDNDKPFIGGIKLDEYFDTGYLRFEKDRVTEIAEKPGKGNEPSEYASLVFDFFPDPEAFFQLLGETTSERDDVFEVALSKLLAKEEFGIVKYEGFWVPMKYPWHILDYMARMFDSLSEHRGKNVVTRQNVIIEGPVWTGDNVKIFENSKIVGPCYIGENTIVGNNNIVRESHIGANCVTGFNTDITRSYVGDNCWFHSNYVGNSVLEENVSLGSGTVLANLRLDEGEIYSVVKGERMNTKRNKLGAIIAKDVRIGVNTSIMPGVKIGTNSMIGAGLVVDRDIAENTFCYGETELVMKKNERGVIEGVRDPFRKKI